MEYPNDVESEVKNFAESSTTLHKKLVAEATTQLIEDNFFQQRLHICS